MNKTEQAEARKTVEAYCNAWLAGDVMTVLSYYHDDLELLWPGQNHLAGTHKGQAASIEALLALQALTNRKPLEVLDIALGNHSVTAIVIEQWSQGEGADAESIELQRCLEFTVENRQLRTCRIYESDQPAIDDFLERALAKSADS